MTQLSPLHIDHGRTFHANRFVYPVLSRRSRGISVGVNLNPDKVCNFDCIYCQVDRTSHSETSFVEIPRLLSELESTLKMATSGRLFQLDPFDKTPAPLRRLNDIAFSGDGEPTTYRNFDELVRQCAEVKSRVCGRDVKMVLITNASMFHRPHVQRGLTTLARHGGEIWAKLEAGTEEYFRLVERTSIPFQQVLDNIALAAGRWPLVIQSLFMRIEGAPPAADEIDAFCQRLGEIQQRGGTIRHVQVYTVARPPAESFVTPLGDAEVDQIRDRIRQQTGLPATSYYGSSDV